LGFSSAALSSSLSRGFAFQTSGNELLLRLIAVSETIRGSSNTELIVDTVFVGGGGSGIDGIVLVAVVGAVLLRPNPKRLVMFEVMPVASLSGATSASPGWAPFCFLMVKKPRSLFSSDDPLGLGDVSVLVMAGVGVLFATDVIAGEGVLFIAALLFGSVVRTSLVGLCGRAT